MASREAVPITIDCPTCDNMSFEAATISNMWEIAVLVEVLERKGLCTKQNLSDIITELRQENPRVGLPETTFPEAFLLTETENQIIDEILKLLNKNGLTSHQAKHVLERLGGIIEMGEQIARKKITH